MPVDSRSVVSTESARRLADLRLNDETVDDHLDRMLAFLVENDFLAELFRLAVHPHAREAFFCNLFEELGVLALAPAHERREQDDPRTLGQLGDRVDDLLARIAC